MYLKIKFQVEGRGVSSRNNEEVAPSQSKLIQTCNADYSKHRILSEKEFDKLLLNKGIENHLIVNNWPIEWDLDKGCEFILISYRTTSDKESPCENIVAPCCSLFVISEQGKTIDSLICYN